MLKCSLNFGGGYQAILIGVGRIEDEVGQVLADYGTTSARQPTVLILGGRCCCSNEWE
jgi:hypothetical protein